MPFKKGQLGLIWRTNGCSRRMRRMPEISKTILYVREVTDLSTASSEESKKSPNAKRFNEEN